MFAFKKKYFLIIESIKDLKLKNIKKNSKFIIIYRRNDKKIENVEELKNSEKIVILKVSNSLLLTISS